MQRVLNFLTNSRTLSILGVIVLTIFLLLMAQTFCLALLIFMPSVWLARTHKQATTYDPARLLI